MRHIESNTQIACVKWFRLTFPMFSGLLIAVPNGGARNKVTGAILKAEGVVPGVSDLIFLLPNKNYHGLCIEMKTKTGRQSDSQKQWENLIKVVDYDYAIVRTFEEFQKLIWDHLMSRR